ncbi:hypothetical protein JNUCC1_03700 [Lentibacillus sp. JNUCC-1]|nr:hypothetical protein [Lentibacillus sp. JNUCC-1]
MGNAAKQKQVAEEKQEEKSLKGSFVSVMILGVFLIVSWAGVWMLYLSR